VVLSKPRLIQRWFLCDVYAVCQIRANFLGARFMIITGMFYNRREQPLRIGIWYLANGIGVRLYGLVHSIAITLTLQISLLRAASSVSEPFRPVFPDNSVGI
jgi:hypothetical protein